MASVLIVDDDELMLHMYEVAFKSSGHEVTLAKSGTEALSSIASKKPDAMLLDIMMPEMSGIDVLKKLKENAGNASIKTIVLTNLMDQAMKTESFQLGAKDYLLKSDHTPIEVVQKINQQLNS